MRLYIATVARDAMDFFAEKNDPFLLNITPRYWYCVTTSTGDAIYVKLNIFFLKSRKVTIFVLEIFTVNFHL